MSGLSSWQLGLYGGVALMAFLGSGHCFAMCGGIAAFAGVKRAPAYQLGRLLGYLGIGALCGSLGKGILRIFESRPELLLGLSFVFTLMLVIQAWAWWRGEAGRSRAPLAHRFSRWVSRRGGSFGLGLGTAFLPCGWLTTFALIAAGTGSPFQGAGVLAILWAGSLPALFAAALGGHALLGRTGKPVVRKVAALALAVVAFASLSHRIERYSTGGAHSGSGAICGSSGIVPKHSPRILGEGLLGDARERP